jgi:hypothetical protein
LAYASVALQRRVTAIIAATNSQSGFAYPHSGSAISARTNSIVYDVLALTEREIPRHRVILYPAYAWDSVRTAASSSWATGITIVAAVAFAAVALWQWRTKASLDALAPNIVSAFLLAGLSAGKRRRT